MKIRATRCVVHASTAVLLLAGPLAAQGPPGAPQDTDPPFVTSLFAEIATGGVEDRVRERTGQGLAALSAQWLLALGVPEESGEAR